MAQHMGGDGFQPPGQVHERRTACDISLTLCLSAQLLCCALPQLLGIFTYPPETVHSALTSNLHHPLAWLYELT